MRASAESPVRGVALAPLDRAIQGALQPLTGSVKVLRQFADYDGNPGNRGGFGDGGTHESTTDDGYRCDWLRHVLTFCLFSPGLRRSRYLFPEPECVFTFPTDHRNGASRISLPPQKSCWRCSRTHEPEPAVAAGPATGIPRSMSADGTIGPSPTDGSTMPASSQVCRPRKTPSARR
jgi:hypothetical protein